MTSKPINTLNYTGEFCNTKITKSILLKAQKREY